MRELQLDEEREEMGSMKWTLKVVRKAFLMLMRVYRQLCRNSPPSPGLGHSGNLLEGELTVTTLNPLSSAIPSIRDLFPAPREPFTMTEN